MRQVPNLIAPMVSKAFNCIEPWISFFQQFAQPPSPIMNLDIGVSPFAYTAVEPGCIYVTGGTVSAVAFTRGGTVITLAVNTLIPVCIGDIVTVTYSVLPTVKFLPNYANPRT